MTSERTLFCPIRKNHVLALPEECVRVQLLNDLISKLGFPESGIAIERQLSKMPHLNLSFTQTPNRRLDILCFAKGIYKDHDLYPLLLIECKAVKLTEKMVNQVVGYNRFLRACFICLINEEEIRTGWYDIHQKQYRFIPFLPSYAELMNFQTNASQPGNFML